MFWNRKHKVKMGCTVTTAGVTDDGKYSLAINEINGEKCLAVHKCEIRGGLHWSFMDERSLVTYIGRKTLARAIELMGNV